MRRQRIWSSLWAVVGLVVSLPTFVKLLGLGFFFWFATVQGRTPSQYVAATLLTSQTSIVPIAVLMFVTYWLAMVWLVAQFVRGKRLSALATCPPSLLGPVQGDGYFGEYLS